MSDDILGAVYGNIRHHGLADWVLREEWEWCQSSRKSSSFLAAQMSGMKVQVHLQAAHQAHWFRICCLKNAPETASNPYGWCPSPVPEAHKS